MPAAITKLVQQFETTYTEHMQGLPIVNAALHVEAVGFQEFDGHQLGVLVTPWFMNLVLLPGTDEWDGGAQGESTTIEFPSGPIEFVSCNDAELGTYLSAILFRSVTDVKDQDTARLLASEIMGNLMRPAREERTVSRRDLFTGLRAS